MLIVHVLWSLAQALIIFLGPKFTPQSEANWLQLVAITSRIAIDWTCWLGTNKKNKSLAILGQAPKDLYNEHALSNVKGMLNWQNVNKFHLCHFMIQIR